MRKPEPETVSWGVSIGSDVYSALVLLVAV